MDGVRGEIIVPYSGLRRKPAVFEQHLHLAGFDAGVDPRSHGPTGGIGGQQVASAVMLFQQRAHGRIAEAVGRRAAEDLDLLLLLRLSRRRAARGTCGSY